MNFVSSSKGVTLLWLVFLTCSTFILASPKPLHGLEARQALASMTSFAVSSTQSANVNSTIKAHDSSPVPLVNSPLILPSLSGCTSGDTGTVTFTSEFAHHTGFESIEAGEEFWNDTGTVWVIQVVSPGYWVQDLGLFIGNTSDPEDSHAISLDPSSSVIAITAPTHGCISKHIASSYHHWQLASLMHSVCSRQSQSLRSAGLLYPLKRRQTLNQRTHLASQANILAPRIRFLTLQLRHPIALTTLP